jgi:hypothetical protein
MSSGQGGDRRCDGMRFRIAALGKPLHEDRDRDVPIQARVAATVYLGRVRHYAGRLRLATVNAGNPES